MGAPDQAGGAFVVWQQRGMVRMQRLTSNGTPAAGWSGTAGLLVCGEPNYGGWMQINPRTVSDGAWGAYVMWNDYRNAPCTISCYGDPRQIFVQRMAAGGTIAPGWPSLGVSVGSILGRQLPNSFGERGRYFELNPVIVPDGLGGALVAWSEVNSYAPFSDAPGIHVQRIGPDGARLWGDRGVVVCGSSSGTAYFPSVAADGGGGAYVVWEDVRDPSGSRIYVQHVSSAGNPLLAPDGERIAAGSQNDEQYAQVVAQDGGGAIVVWLAGSDTDRRSLYARSLTTDKRAHIAIDAPLCDDAQPDGEIALVSSAGRGAWVAWIAVTGAGRVIRAQRLLPTAIPAVGWENGVTVSSPSPEPRLPLLVDAGGRSVYVGWRSGAPHVARLLANGQRARGWPADGLALLQQDDQEYGMHMVPDGASGAIIAWEQLMSFSGLDDIRAQRVRPLDVTPLDPFTPGGNQETLDAGGPSPAAFFALEGLRPNPARGPVAIAFSLPSAAPATLEVFDLFGRRVLQREVGGLGAGVHRVTLGPETALHPGIYEIRLTQGERRLHVRGIVTR